MPLRLPASSSKVSKSRTRRDSRLRDPSVTAAAAVDLLLLDHAKVVLHANEEKRIAVRRAFEDLWRGREMASRIDVLDHVIPVRMNMVVEVRKRSKLIVVQVRTVVDDDVRTDAAQSVRHERGDPIGVGRVAEIRFNTRFAQLRVRLNIDADNASLGE